MRDTLLKLYIKVEDLMTREDGQDLVEYALILALLTLAAFSIMKTLYSTIGTTYTNIQAKFSDYAG